MIDVILVLLSTSLCLGVPGCFLVLRRLSMTADAVSHAVLLGIALGFFFVRDLNSPVLIVSAALFGLFSILLTEWIALRCHIARDEALGLVFPVFFALGVILVTRCFRNVHLDTELILMGNPLFAPFLQSFGLPRAVIANLLLFAVNLIFVLVCFRPLGYACFDPSYASLLGLPLTRIFYMLLTLSAFSAVVAFQSVGAVLSIAFFIAAAAAARVVCALRLRAMESTKSASVKAEGKRFSSIAARGSPCNVSARATALKMASSRASLLGEYCVSREMR